MHQRPQSKKNLVEGLRSADLKNMVSDVFTIDQYKSKMGKDEDIIVVSFRVDDKFPATDLMEFIEKGYPFVLDADMSTGEEHDGKYAVFVEFERKPSTASEIKRLLEGISRLCGHDTWKFKYYKDIESHEFTEEAINEFVPLTVEEYKQRTQSETIDSVSEILDQGATNVVDMDENYNITITKPFAEPLTLELEQIGSYDKLIDSLEGGLQLDESSNSQVLYLEKYLGPYEIHKIGGKFIIKNGDKAMIVNKRIW